VHAARLALEARRRRAFAPAWPSADLTPQRRLAVLAAVLPAATLTTTAAASSDEFEPVDETGPGYRIEQQAGITSATAVAAEDGGIRVTHVVSSRLPTIARRVAERLPMRRCPFRR